MNQLKRMIALFGLFLAISATYFCVYHFGLTKTFSDKQEIMAFVIMILFILTPLIVIGRGIFGYNSLNIKSES